MKLSYCNSRKNLDDILDALIQSDMTRQELAKSIGISDRTIKRYMSHLRQKKLIHIAGYQVKEGKIRHQVPLYRAGEGEDVLPDRMSGGEYNARYLAKKYVSMELVAKTEAQEIKPFRDPMLFLLRKAA